MFIEHKVFKLPKDENTKIWRYLDLKKLLSIIVDESLYFCKTSLLEDSMEGCSAIHNGTNLRHLQNMHRNISFVNCWHSNNSESQLMWKVYSSQGEGICIQSTISRLKEAFADSKESIYIGKVSYGGIPPKNNILYPFMYKREFFKEENEFRALVWDTKLGKEITSLFIEELKEDEIRDLKIQKHTNLFTDDVSKKMYMEALAQFSFHNGPAGKKIHIGHEGVKKIIENIYFGPKTEIWVRDLVIDILVKYGYSELCERIISSGLD